MAVLHSSRLSRSTATRRTTTYPLIHKLGQMHQVKPEQVLVGCGSTDMLRMAAAHFSAPVNSSSKLLQRLKRSASMRAHQAQAWNPCRSPRDFCSRS